MTFSSFTPLNTEWKEVNASIEPHWENIPKGRSFETWDLLPMRHVQFPCLRNSIDTVGIHQSRIVWWGPAWRLGESQSPLHIIDAVALHQMLAACKVSSAQDPIFQELGVLHKYPTSVNFHSTFLQGIQHTYRHDLIHPLVPSEAGRGPAWLPLLNIWRNKAWRWRETFPRWHSKYGTAEKEGKISSSMPYTSLSVDFALTIS